MYNPDKAHYISHTAIIVQNNKFLIVKRAPTEKAFPEMWTVPGGSLKTHDYNREPDTEAGHWYNVGELVCKREVSEEVGLDVPIEQLNYVTSLSFKLPNGIPIFVNSYYILLESENIHEIVLCDELIEYKWVNLEEAKSYELIPGIWEELEMVDKILKGKQIGSWKKK